MDKKFWATTFTLTGTIIGAGILGLPYVFAQSGFMTGVFWLIFIGAIMIFINLALGEITLRTKGEHQLPGYAGKYIGKWGERVMLFAMLFGVYSALLAYLVGEGESISQLLPGNFSPLFCGIAFWIIMTLLLREGLKGLKNVETYGVIAVTLIILGVFFSFLPGIETNNLSVNNSSNFFLPIGVIMFALLGFTSIPELREEIRGKEKKLRKAIIIGTTLPIALYIIFTSVFVGVLGQNVDQVATLSFGPLVKILGVFTMFTSYLVLSFSLKDTFQYDLKFKKETNFALTSITPLALYLLVTQFQLVGFALILGVGGVVSGGLTGIMILIMANKAKKHTREKGKDPEINVPINWKLTIILSIVLIVGMILEFGH